VIDFARHDVSDLAAHRADEMLPALQRELALGVRRRRSRAPALGASAAIVLLAGATITATLTTRSRPAPPAPPAPPSAPAVPVAEAPPPVVDRAPAIEVVRSLDAPLIEVVRDSPRGAPVRVYAASTVDIASISVTDRELLDLLNEIGRPSGLVRANGRVWLTAAVTDDELAPRHGGT